MFLLAMDPDPVPDPDLDPDSDPNSMYLDPLYTLVRRHKADKSFKYI